MEPFHQELNVARQEERRPAVSVIIPAYNTAAYIGETLESVFAQTFRDFGVIVINDGSPDTEDLERAIEPYRDQIVYIRQENGGAAAARNAGIQAARAPWIALLDSDDIWDPEYLAVQLAVLESDPAIDVIYPNAIYFGDSPEAGMEFMELCPSEGEVTFESLVTQKCNVMVSAMARRETVIRAGLFDTDRSILGAEDFELWLRLAKQGARIDYHRRVLVRYRRHPGNLTSNPIRCRQQTLRVLEKIEQGMALTESEKKALDEGQACLHAELRYLEGKAAFFKDDSEGAIAALLEANSYFHSWRISLVIFLLRLAPRALLHAYDVRDRLLVGASTKF